MDQASYTIEVGNILPGVMKLKVRVLDHKGDKC